MRVRVRGEASGTRAHKALRFIRHPQPRPHRALCSDSGVKGSVPMGPSDEHEVRPAPRHQH